MRRALSAAKLSGAPGDGGIKSGERELPRTADRAPRYGLTDKAGAPGPAVTPEPFSAPPHPRPGPAPRPMGSILRVIH